MSASIDFVALVGKGGSVLSLSWKLMRELDWPVQLHAVFTHRERYQPEDPSLLHYIPWQGRTEYFDEVERVLEGLPADLLAFSWFDRLMPASFFEQRRTVNQHPSLLPSYPGKNAWERLTHDHGVLGGTTIHEIDAGIDTGPPLVQHSMRVNYRNDLVAERHRLFLLQVAQVLTFFRAVLQEEDFPVRVETPFESGTYAASEEAIREYFQSSQG